MLFPRRSFLTRLPLFGLAVGTQPPFAEGGHSFARPSSQSLAAQLAAEFDDMWIVDTHEHLLDEQERISLPVDLFDLLSDYPLDDISSAGMPIEVRRLVLDKSVSDTDRWRAIEPYWKASRYTGFCQNLRLAIHDIYGFDEISASTIRGIDDAIRLKNKPGFYKFTLKDRARIRFCVQDDRRVHPTKMDPEYYRFAREFDDFVTPQTRADIGILAQLVDISVTTLKDLKRALEARFQEAMNAGMVAVKTLLAYKREIYFRVVEQADAERDFEALLRDQRPSPEGWRGRVERPYRNLEDYLFHQMLQLADAHAIPIQVHTGITQQSNFIVHSNPVLMTNLFCAYPRTRFDLFHIGYPYMGELSALAKMFPNVWIDFCWAHIISSEASRQALGIFLDTVPSNKIFAFGGDHNWSELTYAHAKTARRNVAQVLAAKVESGFCTETEALELGRNLLCNNAAEFYAVKSGAMADLTQPN